MCVCVCVCVCAHLHVYVRTQINGVCCLMSMCLCSSMCSSVCVNSFVAVLVKTSLNLSHKECGYLFRTRHDKGLKPKVCNIFSHGSRDDNVSRSVGPLLWSRLKYLGKYSSTTTRKAWIDITFCTDIHDPQRMYSPNFGDPLTLHPPPSSCQKI